MDMTQDFIHTSLYCRFLTTSVKKYNKKGVTVVVFKISDLEKVNFASFLTRHHNGVLWKMHIFWTSRLHKNFYSEKNGSYFFFQKLTQYGSMIEVYSKAKV